MAVNAGHVVIYPLVLTQDRVAAAFTEWERRYREEPERFQSEQEQHQDGTANDYGEAAAPYFLAILAEQFKAAHPEG